MTRKEKWYGSNWIRKEKRHAIYRRDDLSCVYCEATAETSILSLDHLIPVELGGTNHHRNLVTSCKDCNSSKGSKSLKQFINYLTGKGIDTSKIKHRIRRNIKRKLQK